jgi:hypothetical protein
MPDLLDALDEVEGIVLVDATRSGAPIGSVRRLRAEEVTRAKATSSHGFGVASALLLAQTLGRPAARVEWVGIEAGPRRWGDGRRGGRGRSRMVALALNLGTIAGLDAGADAMTSCCACPCWPSWNASGDPGRRIVGVRLEVGDLRRSRSPRRGLSHLCGRHGRGGRDTADR